MCATLPSLRTASSTIAEEAGNPLVSITMSAPALSVRSRIACLASVWVTSMQSVAPNARDTANGASRASVTISLPAPERAHSRVRASPIGPCPRTTTLSPRMIRSRSTVFRPTASGSSSDACQASTPSGRGMRLTTGTVTFSVMHPSDQSPISFFFLQSSSFPAAHSGQSVHGSDGFTATGRPSHDPSTPSPTLSTRPAKS